MSITAERKKELKKARKGGPADGFFNMNSDVDETNTFTGGDFGSAQHSGASPSAATNHEDDLVDPAITRDPARAALDEKMNELDQTAPAQPQ